MSITGIAGTTGIGTAAGAASQTNGKSPADFEAILEAFKKAASETPEQRARDAVLKKHDLSEEDYKKLPPKERDAIDREIAEAVRKVHERKTGVAIGDAPVSVEKMLG
jgi:acyl-CoA reductase-like NAD-dependent aldehyde dehydrogenase